MNILHRVFKDFGLCGAFLFLMGAFVLYSCSSGNSPGGPSANAQVALAVREPGSWAATESLTLVTITVSASDITTIEKILTSAPWKTTIHVAAGSNRKIGVAAISSLSNQYYGSATVNLAAGETKQVTITLTLNNAPVISDISFSGAVLPASGTTTMTCVASDPDGDALTYTWNVDKGSIASQTGNQATYQGGGPSASGAVTVTCGVSDGKGGTDSRTEYTTAAASGAAIFAPAWW